MGRDDARGIRHGADTDNGGTDIAAALARFSDGGARADLRVGSLVVRLDEVRADVERVAARYNETRAQLEDAKKRLAALAAARSTALQAVYAARGSDVALQQARLVEAASSVPRSATPPRPWTATTQPSRGRESSSSPSRVR